MRLKGKTVREREKEGERERKSLQNITHFISLCISRIYIHRAFGHFKSQVTKKTNGFKYIYNTYILFLAFETNSFRIVYAMPYFSICADMNCIKDRKKHNKIAEIISSKEKRK